MKRCDKCEFWEPPITPPNDSVTCLNDSRGECRIHPKVERKYADDWCGEFEPKEEPCRKLGDVFGAVIEWSDERPIGAFVAFDDAMPAVGSRVEVRVVEGPSDE